MALPSDFNYGSWEGTPLTAADYSPQMLAEIERLLGDYPTQLANWESRYGGGATYGDTDNPDRPTPDSAAAKYAQYIGSIVRRDRAMGYDIDASGLSTTRPSSVSRPSADKMALISAAAILGGGAAYGAAGGGAAAGGGEAGLAGLGEGVGANAYFANAPAAGGAGGITAGQALSGAGLASSVAGGGADYSGPEFQGEVPPQSTGPGPTFDAFGNPVGGGGYFPTGSAGAGALGTAAAGSALSRIIDGSATTADWVSVLGTAGATGLGMFSANQQANTLERLAAENRADRLPYLQASQGYLADPESYVSGPGAAAMKGTLAGLSAKFGNPIGSPTAMAISNEAALRDWRDAVTGFGNMGLSGADTRANLGMAGATADANKWTTLAGGISNVVNPPRSLADLLREYKTVFA